MNTIVTTQHVDEDTTDVFYLGVFIGRIIDPITGKTTAHSKWVESPVAIRYEKAHGYIIDTHKSNMHRIPS